ncbi:MAG: hypothetical protein L7F77_07015 [Candidatus Magnetominusculus sp. LBB02]|nr:hypothetical protein [Candidatus Magnetominusculus sp. LBB02]
MIYSKGRTLNWLFILITAAVLTLSLSSPCFSASDYDDETPTPAKKTKKKISKEETFAYIKERCTVDNDNVETKDNVYLEGCMFISETKSNDGKYMHRRYAPLDKLNPESTNNGIWPSTNGTKFGLIANSVSYATKDEKPHVKFVVERPDDKYNSENMQNYGYFQCETEAKAAQAAKALKHLIKLCGGEKQKDLFDD